MRACLPYLGLILLILAGSAFPGEQAGDTTVIVVRHAEKSTADDSDPSLSEEGKVRAQALVTALEHAHIDSIYATQFRRTRSTAAPLARRFGLETRVVPVSSGDIEQHARELAERVRDEHAGETILIVGHSNTVPAIVEALGDSSVAPIDESEYDHLYIVNTQRGRPARIIHSRYGAP